jgi:hypothetical protein
MERYVLITLKHILATIVVDDPQLARMLDVSRFSRLRRWAAQLASPELAGGFLALPCPIDLCI